METGSKEQKDLKKEVSKALRKLGISCKFLGYEYIREAVLLCIENSKYIYSITKKMYPAIARNFSAPGSRVKELFAILFILGGQKQIQALSMKCLALIPSVKKYPPMGNLLTLWLTTLILHPLQKSSKLRTRNEFQ